MISLFSDFVFLPQVYLKKSVILKGRDSFQPLVHGLGECLLFRGGKVYRQDCSPPRPALPGKGLAEYSRGGSHPDTRPGLELRKSSKHCGTSTRITRNNAQSKRLLWVQTMSRLPSVPKSLFIYQIDLTVCLAPSTC